MNITINTDIFAAVALFRAINDIRYYLNGLYLEAGAHGARLVGCDGHQLAVARIEGKYTESSIILPSSLVAAVKAKARSPKLVTLEFSDGGQQLVDRDNAKNVFVPRDITLTYGETTTTAKELDGKFPDYRRVVPAEADGTAAQFDPKLVKRIDRACSVLGYKFFAGIAHNGKSSALSVVDDSFLIVTMPFNIDPVQVAPLWVQEPLLEQELDRFAA
jgi:DNA polymerase-3 subunit beta